MGIIHEWWHWEAWTNSKDWKHRQLVRTTDGPNLNSYFKKLMNTYIDLSSQAAFTMTSNCALMCLTWSLLTWEHHTTPTTKMELGTREVCGNGWGGAALGRVKQHIVGYLVRTISREWRCSIQEKIYHGQWSHNTTFMGKDTTSSVARGWNWLNTGKSTDSRHC